MIRPSDLPDFEQLRTASRNELDALLAAPDDDFEVATQLELFMDRALQSRRIGDIARTVPNYLAGEAARALDARCAQFAVDERWAALRVRALVFRNRGVKGGSRQRLQDRVEAESIAQSLGNAYLTGYAIKWQGEAFGDLGKPKDSIREYHRALDVFTEEFNRTRDPESLVAGLACANSLIVKYRSNGRFEDAMDLLSEMRSLEAGTGLDRDGFANLIRAAGVACRIFGQMDQWRALVHEIESIGDQAAAAGDSRTAMMCRRIFVQTTANEEQVYFGNLVRALELNLDATELVVRHGAGPLSTLVELLNTEVAIRRRIGPDSGDFPRALEAVDMARVDQEVLHD